MTSKDKRIIERDLTTLFSKKAFLVLATVEKWKNVGFFHPTVRTDLNSHPLSDAGIAALRRITRIVQNIPELHDSCSSKEIAEQVHECYEGWLKRSVQPDAQEFVDEARGMLLATVKEHLHLVTIEGLDIGEMERVDLGPTSICKSDMAILGEIQYGGAITEDWVRKEFARGLWLIGKSQGSPEMSFQRFEHQTVLTVGILAVCGAILFEGAIWQSYLRAVLSPYQQAAPTSILRWETGGGNPTISRSWSGDKKLPLTPELITYLRTECFLDQLSGLSSIKSKTELQDSIVRALYWFADAHGDRNPTMRFIKLWSCAECFFAITEKDITESNARGIATVLTFAGYGVGKPEEYRKLKRRLKELYDLRSRAIHRGEFGSVQLQDLQDLSRWIAWIIISMMALSQRGYKTLEAVKKQVIRLDDAMNRE